MSSVIELDIHCSMTPDQVLRRCQRDEYDEVIVLGRKGQRLLCAYSEMSTETAYSLLSKATQNSLKFV